MSATKVLPVFALLLTCSAPCAARASTTVNAPGVAVTATVQSVCTISAAPLAFGTYSGAKITASTSVVVTCTNTTPYNVGLNAGAATGATVSTRKMTGPASSLLSYSLTQDAAGATNWGMTVGTDTKTGTGSGAAQTLTVYGTVAAGQYVTPGSYSDTIIASVTY